MIIYPSESLKNLQLIQEIQAEAEYTGITAAEIRDIAKACPVTFYTPAFLVRAGLFLLTFVIICASAALLALLFSEMLRDRHLPYALIIFGLLCYAALETVCEKYQHYQAGTDDALTLLSSGFLLTGVLWLNEISTQGWSSSTWYLYASLSTAVISLWYVIRFASRLMTVISASAFLMAFLTALHIISSSGILLLPFGALVFAASLCWLNWNTRIKAILIFYRPCLAVSMQFAVFTAGLACNYYVADQTGKELSGVAFQVPLPYFFWAWTFVFPLACIGYALKKHSRMLLNSGLILLVAAGLTFRYYYTLLPLESLLTSAGALLLLFSWRLIKWLKHPKYGLTDQVPFPQNSTDQERIDSIIISATLPQQKQHLPDRFGGGNFGGGGSSSDF
ncbi:hypothetical protein [Pedobacter antarcticus]|uniref:hypothetical protein n=1 Tax=Pedobacter antarcticus TaxID=34086 RepID=UPI00292EA9C8|nr:hypothetical protein [Pedobacter antarcticus]